jgi:acyl-CoA hydrolase
MPIKLTAANLASVLPPGGLTLVQGCSGESTLLAGMLGAAGPAVGAMNFIGIFVPSLNRVSWLPNADCRVTTFFMTPELKRAGAAVDFLPLCYADILAYLRGARISAALFMAAPPDGASMCSFGPVVDFLAELWPQIPVRIAQINPLMPATHGHPGIPYAELTAVIEQETPLLGMAEEKPDPATEAIGRFVAGLVPDGATLQMGVGKIPGAVLRALNGHKGLRIHSGLVGEAVLELAAAGALAEGAAVTAGVAIGSPRLYDAVRDPLFAFRPVSFTHDPGVLAGIPRLVTINSALSVDLYGQAFSELTPRGFMSGSGGASDFARGAKAAGGLRVIALPAARIVAPGAGLGPVTLGRMDIDVVVTELGAADLRGLGHKARAAALVNVALPEERSALEEAVAFL